MAALNRIPAVEELRLMEWRAADEVESGVRLRMVSIFNQAAQESAQGGPTGLVSHGGPIALLLQELGIDRDELAKSRTMFDTRNPLRLQGFGWWNNVRGKRGRGLSWCFGRRWILEIRYW